MDKEFDELVGRTWPQVTRSAGAGFVPAIEVVREGNDVLIRLELPGMDVERDVSIEVQRGRLVV
ncbi:MAG TPA: Hsp20/alpha crystallin family protein, partial [Mycobacteriales bacterium]|nr:Hsp20/alpha crystallin family protein [Mycobacteriales bacterium]